MKRNVFIKQDPTTEKTASGIYLPASLQDTQRENFGTVVRTGPGTDDEPMQYAKGDRVKFDPYAGRDITFNGEDLKILADTDVYCLIKN